MKFIFIEHLFYRNHGNLDSIEFGGKNCIPVFGDGVASLACASGVRRAAEKVE